MLSAAHFPIGQRVHAHFPGWSSERLGVVSGAVNDYGDGHYTVPVQIEPAGCHYYCHSVSPFGDRNGWTDREYRVAREDTTTRERAAAVETERREKYPDAPFSAYVVPPC